MQIHLHISPGAADKKTKNASVTVPEGSTVRQALEAYNEARSENLNLAYMRGVTPIINRKPGNLGDVLNDNDTVVLIKYLRGG